MLTYCIVILCVFTIHMIFLHACVYKCEVYEFANVATKPDTEMQLTAKENHELIVIAR